MEQVNVTNVESMPSYLSDASQLSVSSKKLDDLGKKLSTRLAELRSLRERSQWETDKQLDFDSYHLREPRKALPYKGYPNLACPLPRIGIDTFHANVMFTFGGQQGRFTVLPEILARSNMDAAERGAKYMTYVLNYEADLYTALDKADMDAEKYGVGYMEPQYVKDFVWESREVTTEEVVPGDPDPITGIVPRKVKKSKKKERIKKPTFDGVKVRRIAPECILVSPFFEEIEDAVKNDVLFKVSTYTFKNIEALSKSEDKDTPPFFEASRVKLLKDVQRHMTEMRLEQNKQKYDGFMVSEMVERMPLELAEAHLWEDMNGDGLPEKITVVFETTSGVVLRISNADCRIVKLAPRPVDGRWYGESIRKATEPMIMEWEAIHNQRVAKGQWANLPFFFYKAGGRFNPQMITLMPGKGYPVDDPSGVNFPQPPSPDMSYFQEEKLLLDYIDRILALGDVIQGVAGRADTTATETIHAQQRAGIRLSTPMNRIATALNRLVGYIWELNKQCAPDIKEFKVAGVGNGIPVFEKITNNDYDVNVTYKLNMATMYDVQMVRDTALLNYKTFIANPLIMQHPAAFYLLTKNTMKAVGLDLEIPAPEQAKAKSPFVEHDLIRRGELVEPVVGEDVDSHMAAHMALIKSEDFQAWPPEAQQALFEHVDKTQILKQTLEAANLNQSGVFAPAGGLPPQAGMTATRNPSQTFNNLRVEETGKSQQQNVQNGMAGGGY